MIKFSHKELIIPYFILFLVLVLSIYPLLYMISTSLMTSGEASNQYLFPKKLMFENYIQVWDTMMNTLYNNPKVDVCRASLKLLHQTSVQRSN